MASEGKDEQKRAKLAVRMGKVGGRQTAESQGRDLRNKSNYFSRLAFQLAEAEGRDIEGKSNRMKRVGKLAHKQRDEQGKSILGIRNLPRTLQSFQSRLSKVSHGIKSRTRDGCDIAISGQVEIDGEKFDVEGCNLRAGHRQRNDYQISVSTLSAQRHIRCLALLARSTGYFSKGRTPTSFV
jgi:hypothetical protein